MEIGNVRVLIGASIIGVCALAFTATQFIPKPAPKKPSEQPIRGLQAPNLKGPALGAPPTTTSGSVDPFGLPSVATSGQAPSSSLDLGFGGPAVAGSIALTNAVPAVAAPSTVPVSSPPPASIDSKRTRSKVPTPFKGGLPTQPRPLPPVNSAEEPSVEPLGVTMPSQNGTLPSAAEIADAPRTGDKKPRGIQVSQNSEDRAAQSKPISVILRAIVRTDGGSVAYIEADGQPRGCRVGRSIGGNVIVKKITDDEVTLTRGAKTVTLSVGMSEGL